jgi:hypothetical protein
VIEEKEKEIDDHFITRRWIEEDHQKRQAVFIMENNNLKAENSNYARLYNEIQE